MRWARSLRRGRAWARQMSHRARSEIAAVAVRLQGFVAGAANHVSGKVELTADGVESCQFIDRGAGAAEPLLPQRALFGFRRLVDFEGGQAALQHHTPILA